ncbi:DUF4411 family protein [Sporolactobacillus vineae]|uniref:DUF4411 family protein n=1 Tax=Sporolactobacillus vineae TaxID=444463 RepID=UPI000287ED6F|nr:DUF4411 family protein [Sporolactobacillus vineae]
MSSSPLYVLDTNIFVQAYKTYYSFDLAPSFWKLIVEQAKRGKILTIDRAKQEIDSYNKDDPLKKWADMKIDTWCKSTNDTKVISSYVQIIDWVMKQNSIKDYAKEEFGRICDSWIIAFAHAYSCTVVTQEKYDSNCKKRVKIPNVCEAFHVPYMGTFEMMRKLNMHF